MNAQSATFAKQAAALFALMLALGAPAAAWQSEVHSSIIQLSNNLFSVPGIATADKPITLPDQIPFVCEQRRHNNAYFALLCGTTSPDAKKTWLRAISHENNADVRAKNALACAVHRLRAEGASHVAVAAQLGHSLHYLQDLSDPSNDLGGRKDEARQFMKAVLDNALKVRNQLSLDTRLAQARARYQELLPADQIIRAGRRVAGEFGRRLDEAIANLSRVRRQGGDVRSAQIALLGVSHEFIAHMVALQERWIALFDAGLRDWDRNPNYCRDACYRRGPLTSQGSSPPAPPSPSMTGERDLSRCFSRDGRHDLCRRNNYYIPERRERVCMSGDGRHDMCRRNNCERLFRNPDGSTFQVHCYWTEQVFPAVPCYWQ